MTLFSSNDKLKRTIIDSENEFMPVTKRMTNLRIESPPIETKSSGSSSSSSSGHNGEDEVGSNDSGYHWNRRQQSLPHHNRNNDADDGSHDLMYLNEMYRTYNPSLKAEQNPVYFEANRVLFQAHQMRVLRMHTNLYGKIVEENQK